MKDLVFANEPGNWFYDKYYVNGINSRYWTFQLAFNILYQREKHPTIVETGCQRQADDIGAGMSTSIFAEYIANFGGELHIVDNNIRHLTIAEKCISKWSTENANRVFTYHNDSVEFLKNYLGEVDLLYLDSWDYPYGELLNEFGGKEDIEKATIELNKLSHTEVVSRFGSIIFPSQQHCVREFKAVEEQLDETSIVLIDDNQLPGGGKPGLLKPYLEEQGWTCLFDFQQTLWIRKIK